MCMGMDRGGRGSRLASGSWEPGDVAVLGGNTFVSVKIISTT